MPLWPGPDRKRLPVQKIFVETWWERLQREWVEGRSRREIEAEASELEFAEVKMKLRQEAEQTAARVVDGRRHREAEPVDYHVSTLEFLSARWTDLEEEMIEAVSDAREDGMSWAVISGGLQVTRQAAQQRFGRVVDRRRASMYRRAATSA